MKLIEQACGMGARKRAACEALGVSVRTVQRWQRDGREDRRQGTRAKPANALTPEERAQVIELMNCPEYQDLSPNQIVPRLADEGVYLASESTMYRLLRQEKMTRHRQASQPATSRRPKPAVAAGPNQVWSWDITWLPTQIRGIFVYLYMMIDIYSRKIAACTIEFTR